VRLETTLSPDAASALAVLVQAMICSLSFFLHLYLLRRVLARVDAIVLFSLSTEESKEYLS
jgi:hypothetical protein